MIKRRELDTINDDGTFKNTPREFPNIFKDEEYPLNFIFFHWAIHAEELNNGDIVGEANTPYPHQDLIWVNGGVEARAKGRPITIYDSNNHPKQRNPHEP